MTYPPHLAGIVLLLALTTIPSIAQDRGDPIDRSVVLLVAENAEFMSKCGKAFPAHRAAIEAAFNDWAVLRLPIPGLSEALDAHSEMRQAMTKRVSKYFGTLPSHEIELECGARMAMIRAVRPTLRGDSAKLPPDALLRYGQR